VPLPAELFPTVAGIAGGTVDATVAQDAEELADSQTENHRQALVKAACMHIQEIMGNYQPHGSLRVPIPVTAARNQGDLSSQEGFETCAHFDCDTTYHHYRSRAIPLIFCTAVFLLAGLCDHKVAAPRT